MRNDAALCLSECAMRTDLPIVVAEIPVKYYPTRFACADCMRYVSRLVPFAVVASVVVRLLKTLITRTCS